MEGAVTRSIFLLPGAGRWAVATELADSATLRVAGGAHGDGPVAGFGAQGGLGSACDMGGGGGTGGNEGEGECAEGEFHIGTFLEHVAGWGVRWTGQR